MRIVTQKEMKDLEAEAQKMFHFPEKLIIENVALRAAKAITEKLGDDINAGELIFLIGRGNNGGTGLAIARHLASMGHESHAFLLFDKNDRQPNSWEAAGEVFTFSDKLVLSDHFKLYYKDEVYRQERARMGNKWHEGINFSRQQEGLVKILTSFQS